MKATIVFGDATDPDNGIGALIARRQTSGPFFFVQTGRPFCARRSQVDGGSVLQHANEAYSDEDSKALCKVLGAQLKSLFRLHPAPMPMFDGGYAPNGVISQDIHVLDFLANKDPTYTTCCPLSGAELKAATQRHKSLSEDQRVVEFYAIVRQCDTRVNALLPLDDLWRALEEVPAFDVIVMGPFTAFAKMPVHLFQKIGEVRAMVGTLDPQGGKNIAGTCFNNIADQPAFVEVYSKFSPTTVVVLIPTEAVKRPRLYLSEHDLDKIDVDPRNAILFAAVRAKMEQWCNKGHPGAQPVFDVFTTLPLSELSICPATIEFGDNPKAMGTPLQKTKTHVVLTGPPVDPSAPLPPGLYSMDDTDPDKTFHAFRAAIAGLFTA